MTLEELAGQVLWCGWGDGDEPDPAGYNDHARLLVEELQVGGLVLFPRNLGTAEEIAALTTRLRARAKRSPLIGIDQEGGRIARLARPGLVFVPNECLGRLDQPQTTQAAARAIGEQLAALGITVNFAPDIDVNNNPRNPVINNRSFGADPERVARHGCAALAGYLEAGIVPVVKHFPGHGDTSVDSHLALPELAVDRARLDAVELVPFRAALAAGAPAVMSAHILFRELDPERPGTLSRRILTGLLREELGFDGLVVTDCLEMRGIADHWTPEETAVLALQAGADMLLVCHSLETQQRMHAAVCRAVREGELSEARLAESAARIERCRALTAVVEAAPRAPEKVGSEPYVALERDLRRACGIEG
ncbi:MAG: glycoside hydrolase family 3 protein [Armatimonadota bacterium]